MSAIEESRPDESRPDEPRLEESGPQDAGEARTAEGEAAEGKSAGGRPAERKRKARDETTSSAFEAFANWVPPWARSNPELVVEPAADYAPEELGIGRLAYADPDELPNPDEFEPELADDRLRGAVEAILFVVDEPVTTTLLAQVLEEPTARIEATLAALGREYTETKRGFELRQVAGGWRLYTRPEFAEYVERFVLDGQQIRLTQAALETLAVIAYKQPVTRSRVAAIRGVNVDGVVKTLVTRGLVEECGVEPETGAHLYRTTKLFLEKLGINSVDELPSVAQFLPDNVDELDVN
ncbi:MAG TPA: SMC-Scp complex subunit ScpB [Micromonosporaceae bacterium]|nr:SMC-Scp complex subunit ScpB [Micromonosporaceae bacterium]